MDLVVAGRGASVDANPPPIRTLQDQATWVELRGWKVTVYPVEESTEPEEHLQVLKDCYDDLPRLLTYRSQIHAWRACNA